MTREEAIEVLKLNYPSVCFTDLCEAVDMAIEALSKMEKSDEMNDLIHRQDAINLLEKWADGYNYIEVETESAIKQFQHLPSAIAKQLYLHNYYITDKGGLQWEI